MESEAFVFKDRERRMIEKREVVTNLGGNLHGPGGVVLTKVKFTDSDGFKIAYYPL